MDKIKEFLEDRNNMIIAIAIAVVLVIGIVVIIGLAVKKGSDSKVNNSTTNISSGNNSIPNNTNMSGNPNKPGNPNGAPGLNPYSGNQTQVADASESNDNPFKGKPQEAGRIDPFAPIGVAKASKTKTFGDAIKSRMTEEGINWSIPDLLTSVSFTDYVPGETKIGYIKTAADYKREKDKIEAKKKAEQDKINAIIYTKPTNIRLSGIIKGNKGSTASLQVISNGRDDYKAVSEGEEFIYGYNGYSPLKAVVKKIDADNQIVILKPKDTSVEWKFNLSEGNRNIGRTSTGFGMTGMNPVGANPMGMSPMGMNPMGTNPMGGYGGAINPSMMNPGVSGMNSFNPGIM